MRTKSPFWTSRSPPLAYLSQAMQHFLPKCSSSMTASSHPKSGPTQQPRKPTLPATQAVPKPEPRQHSRSTRHYPFPKLQGPRPKLVLDLAPPAFS